MMSSPGVAQLSVALLLAVLAALAPPSTADVACAPKCTTSLDCSLNGICDTGTGSCQCQPAWTGPCCSALNFEPVSATAFGYRAPNTSTWGGNILKDSAGRYHMWIAEMAPNGTAQDPGAGSCGLTTWGSNSQVTHVVSSTGAAGPYSRREVAVPIWSHNPLVRRMTDGTLVMYHIGSGAGGLPKDGYCAFNGTSPCGEQSFDKCAGAADGCSAGAVSGWGCHAGMCSGDGGGVGGASGGDCGADLAEPVLSCNSYATCAPAAAAACAAYPGCVSFGLSSAWGLGKAKLFSAGTGGLTPNPEWNVWVKSSSSGGDEEADGGSTGAYLDMYGRARSLGTHPAISSRERAAAVAAGAPCTLDIHVASSESGPWVAVKNVTISPCGGNNPAPWVAPNGTVYIVFTDQNMGLWSAPSWRGPYTLVTSGACGGGEDPSLYLDAAGNFHCLFHRSPFSKPDIAIGHAYSLDGYKWFVSTLPAANSTIAFDGGYGAVVHGKRERPHLYMDESNAIAAFVSGVCITPACDPFLGHPVDPVACTSAAQYYQCDANSPDGWYDRTYTLVQGVKTA